MNIGTKEEKDTELVMKIKNKIEELFEK